MVYLNIIATIFILTQILFVIQIFRNYRYIADKFVKQRVSYKPKVALIVPCKGLDTAFEKNITSFFQLDYDDYELIFVVESTADAAYNSLVQIRQKLHGRTRAFRGRVLRAGITEQGGQKLHNLLYAIDNISDGVEVLAFADSDACLRPDWLRHLVHPLRKEKNGVSSGYRWFVPVKNNLATLAMASMNAKVAQNLGPTIFNQAWGGSMAVRVDVFRKLGMHQIWSRAISDDLTISRAVKKAGLQVAFVPACIVASFEKTDWPSLFEFTRRQFVITKVTTPGMWWFGLFSSVFSITGLWIFALIGVIFWLKGFQGAAVFLVTSAVFFLSQLIREVMRQRMIFRLLCSETSKMKIAAAADFIAGPLWSVILFICILSSAFGRTISWRGVKYRLINPTEAIRL